MPKRIAYRTCPLCEATCGLELHLDDRAITLVRGDKDDVFSHGFICPKGSAINHLESDPDRVRVPQIRDRATNTWRDATWDEAFAHIEARLLPIIAEHGNDALALYLGNPSVHSIGPQLYNRVLGQAARTRNVFSASTVDQMPKQVSAALMFGTGLSVPIPDIDHTDYLLVLGANPFASNGSLMTAPDVPGRLRAIRARGGRIVVVDPRRSKTAEESDEWVAIVPGTDAHLLLAMAQVLFADDLVQVGDHLAPWVAGLDTVREVVGPFTPEAVEPMCGVPASVIRRLAHELAAAPTAAVYGRIGTCVQEFGTVASWAVDVLNVLTGNLDRRGGAMFNLPAIGGGNTGGTPGRGRGVRFGRRSSRVRAMPEVFGELPVVCLAEEIDTPGDGQVHALITVAGNPVLSNPGSQRLDAALASLDFMVSIDIYRNETTRHADVILPPESLLARGHYDVALRSLAIRNVATYSAPIVELESHEHPEWATMARLAGVLQGLGSSADVAQQVDAAVIGMLVDKAEARAGTDAGELLATISANGRHGPERMLDLMLRTGPYELTLDHLIVQPHGIDLGPLQPRIPEVLRTATGRIELAPEMIIDDVRERVVPALARRPNGGLVLIGRRDLRSNNSWMHNVRVLVKGKPRCTLHVHPDDARSRALVDGAKAKVMSQTGELEIAVEVTDAIRPGVVSIPHGWGHDVDGVDLSIAREHAGVNTNVLTSTDTFDVLSGNAVLSGIPVEVVAT
ncbi:MAG TPA: molybdopterin-dependent oxidoreductase [Acidimicrobiia bacterium]